MRIASVMACVLVTALIASACEPAATPKATAPPGTALLPTREPRGTLKYRISWEPPVKNPIFEPVGGDMAWYFDPLVRLEYDGSVLPRLARAWEHDQEGRVWTFHLQEDAKWHDGQPFSADDVVFTIESIASPELASPVRRYLQVGGETIQVEKLDEHAVRVVLPEPYGPFLSNLSYVGVAPKHLLEGVADMETSAFNRQPVGTGPFKVAEIVDGDHWILVANDEFYLGKPGLAGVYIRISGDPEAMVAALKTGELDITETEEIAHLDWFAQQGGYRIYTCTPGGTTLLFLNILNNPLFQDVGVRRAMTHALDRQGIVDTVTFGYAKVADAAIMGGGFSAWASNRDVPRYGYSLEKAKDLLEQAGWTDSDGDGVLDKEGQAFRFTVTMQAGYATYENTAAVIQANLKDVGIDMQIHALERSAFRALRANPERAEVSDAIFSGATVPFDPDQIGSIYHSSSYAGGSNLYGYSNARVDELLDQGRVMVDREARRPFYVEAQQIIAEEIPYIPIYYYWIGWVVNDRVKRLPEAEDLGSVDPTYYIGWFAERLSIEE